MNKRLESLDALRGLDMLLIMGLGGLIAGICDLFPGGSDLWWAQQMNHVRWDGLHIMDMVFPLFLFIAGMAFPFSTASRRSKGVSEGSLWLNLLRRGLVLVLLGLVYNGVLQLKLDTQRIPSVLGRIGLAWMFAGMIWLAVKNNAWRAVIAAALLLGYWVMHMFVAPDAPAGASPLSPEGSMACYIDRSLLGPHIYKGLNYDPEGLAGTIPAIATALLGMFTGEFVRSGRRSGPRKALYILVAGAVLIALGLLWSVVFPLNKALWSSSFVLVVGGISMILFALMYYIVDVRGWRSWAFPLKVIGLNSITIYMVQRIVKMNSVNKFFFGGAASLFPEPVGAVILAATYILVCWLLLYFLYKHKIFLKV